MLKILSLKIPPCFFDAISKLGAPLHKIFPSSPLLHSFQEQANKQEELKLGHSCIFQRNYILIPFKDTSAPH